MEEKLVVVKWEKIDQWKKVSEKNDEEEWVKIDPWKKALKINRDKDYGIYQITGYHPVFGDDSLLYIGKAQDQTFGKRFKQHDSWLEHESDITIYIGRVTSFENEEKWRKIINDVEPLLIYFHSPPYNSQHVSEPPNPEMKLRIINTGDCGDLYPEISHTGLEKYDKYRPMEE